MRRGFAGAKQSDLYQERGGAWNRLVVLYAWWRIETRLSPGFRVLVLEEAVMFSTNAGERGNDCESGRISSARLQHREVRDAA